MVDDSIFYRQTNWSLFTFFLSVIHQYWNALVYNLNTESFFVLFSCFLNALQDRCSEYKNVKNFRSPWPPYLVWLARTVNKHKRAYRRVRSDFNLNRFKAWGDIFKEERETHIQRCKEDKIAKLTDGNNIWRFAKPAFRPFTPPFKGLSTSSGIVKNPTEIVDILADHFEKHFSSPQHDQKNKIHKKAIEIFDSVSYIPSMPLEPIKFEEVIREWNKFQPKKSNDSVGTSAFILKKLPLDYLGTITILFNKCAASGSFFSAGKVAKTICLSKDGLYPTESKLRPISLLPNIAKWFERDHSQENTGLVP